MKLEILLVDDNSMIRRFLRTSLEGNTEWRVCGEAENGQAAVERVNELHPNVVILDYSMPVMNGLDAARQIARAAPNVVMFLFTLHTSAQLQEDAHRVGIQQVVSKMDRLEDNLLPSLRTVAAAH